MRPSGELVDRMHCFSSRVRQKRSAALLNSVPLDLAGRNLAGMDYQLLYFTRESREDIAAIAQRFLNGQKTEKPHTSGLYYKALL
jgi:hypothetical protein